MEVLAKAAIHATMHRLREWTSDCGRTIENVAFFSVALLSLAAGGISAVADEAGPPTLTIGASAPDFCLPGIDGKTHCLKDYSASKVLVIAFTCNHCPTAQLYESRIKQLAADYAERGVALVAIQPNNPNAVRLDEMGYTDVGDSFEEMKVRAAYRQFNFPYLYDGETQKVARAYGPTATPHLFIFDAERKLRYQGRADNNPREPLVTSRDARNAIDALLAGRQVALAKTPSVGCSTKWLYKEEGRKEELAEIESKPVELQLVNAEELTKLRKNSTGKLLLVNFWANADWNAAVPYTMLIRPGGEVVYKDQGAIHPLEVKRLIVANLADDDYIGHQAYWQTH